MFSFLTRLCSGSEIKNKPIYCYSEEERQAAIQKLGSKPEITRFKGLGEISPDEFRAFIGDEMKLEPVLLSKETSIKKLLTFFMGKNTPQRQGFIIDNLKIEKDIVEEDKQRTVAEAEI
jgi:topoisomerase-4 subunit B